MLRPLRDSEYIFGLHDPGGENIMLNAGKPGWVLFTEALGADPNDQGSRDYTPWSNNRLGVIVRLNHGYEPLGTIPVSSRYADFARRCANFVRNSRGAHIWIIGNEMNFVVERPARNLRAAQSAPKPPAEPSEEPPPSPRERADRFNALHPDAPPVKSTRSTANREVITPQLYATCFRLCREAIRSLPGHEQDQVLVGAVAPWNNQTQYPGNPLGDWVQYFVDILNLLGPDGCDGFTLHTYTHGDNPNLITDPAKMDPPFSHRHYHFLAYRDFMQAVPANMRHLPAYITETDQDVEWRNENTGWVQRAYAEINWWNSQPGNQQIRALILYRWPKLDKWYIDGKQGVIEDFREALKNDYRWRAEPAKPTYRVAWLEGGGLKTAVTGEVLTTRFVLRNDGTKTWAKGGPNPVRIGFHWETGAGQPVLVPPDRDFRTPLPKEVKPGESVTVENVRVAVPDQAGALRLRWDLVEEGITWFRDRGSPERVETVTVKAGLPPEGIVVPETGKRVKGAFLDWYQRYGVDVAGYPITDQYRDPATGLNTQVFQRVMLEEPEPGKVRLRLAGQDLLQAQQRLQEAEAAVAALRAKVSDLEERLRRAGQGGEPTLRIPRPPVEDITASLPRDAAGFKQRPLSAIRYLVLNHTGGSPTVPVEKIAEFHRQRGYPGIAYHYLVDGQGNILQVNPLTETVSDQGYLGEGVNIAIAGKFDDVVPTDAQLDAAARLSAWLLQELRLPPEAIKGVSEFVATGSPGWQWLRGQRYKDRLLRMVAEVQPEPVAPGPTPPADGAELARLQAELAALRSQLADRDVEIGRLRSEAARLQDEVRTRDQRIATLTSQVTRVQAEVTRLQGEVRTRDQRIAALTEQVTRLTQQASAQQAEIVRLQEALARQGAGSAGKVVQPAIFDIVDALPKHPTLRYSQRQRRQITHLCIHHSATPANIAIERVAQYHITADPSRNKEAWPGIGYHFYVKPDGAIYMTNRLETVSYHVYGNNERAVGICVSGDFTRAVPTVEQINSTAHLVAWLMQELNIPEQNVLGHREFPQNDTSCPGVQWLEGRQWRTMLMQTVRAFRTGQGPGVWPKTITHYVLFWQRPDSWAREDWLAAEKYIARFRPTAGFSLDDARNAEFVTIVGGEAGVSREAEQMLRAAGCKVDRLAGVDYADTKRILDTLAETGRRFQSFTVGGAADV